MKKPSVNPMGTLIEIYMPLDLAGRVEAYRKKMGFGTLEYTINRIVLNAMNDLPPER